MSSLALRIRFARFGKHKKPFYRVVVANASSPRDGKFIERLGTYDPFQEENKLNLNVERARYWIKNGAQPNDIVKFYLSKLENA